MSTTTKPSPHRCGSCALFHPHLCDGSDHEDCDAFQPSDLCRIADALEKLPVIEGLLDAPDRGPDLSLLEQELRALTTVSATLRNIGETTEANREYRRAEVVRRCIAIMRGEVAPREVKL